MKTVFIELIGGKILNVAHIVEATSPSSISSGRIRMIGHGEDEGHLMRSRQEYEAVRKTLYRLHEEGHIVLL